MEEDGGGGRRPFSSSFFIFHWFADGAVNIWRCNLAPGLFEWAILPFDTPGPTVGNQLLTSTPA